MTTTARTWPEHPALDIMAELPSIQIVASKLRAGMVLLDPELRTPAASLDHKNRSTRGSGNVEFLAYDYEARNYVPISLHMNALVWVAGR